MDHRKSYTGFDINYHRLASLPDDVDMSDSECSFNGESKCIYAKKHRIVYLKKSKNVSLFKK